jgi:hypothetical protein
MLNRLIENVQWVVRLPRTTCTLWHMHAHLVKALAQQQEEIRRLETIMLEHLECLHDHPGLRPDRQRFIAALKERGLLPKEEFCTNVKAGI